MRNSEQGVLTVSPLVKAQACIHNYKNTHKLAEMAIRQHFTTLESWNIVACVSSQVKPKPSFLHFGTEGKQKRPITCGLCQLHKTMMEK